MAKVQRMGEEQLVNNGHEVEQAKVHELVPAFDQVPLERLESEITELAAHINAATCR